MDDLWEIANSFRFWVCSELRNLSSQERSALRGDYLFVVDSQPRFIVLVDEESAWSLSLFYEPNFSFALDPGCPFEVTLENVQNTISSLARTTITTDSLTLQKLLLGQLKAKIAFLTSKVILSGDLAAFLKMVSLLKRNGVRPVDMGNVSLQ